MAEILGCPWCGHHPTIGAWGQQDLVSWPGATAIECSSDLHDCPVNPCVTGYTRDEAIVAWNRRTPPPQAAGGEPVAWLIDYDTEDGRVRTVALAAPADSMWPYGTIITPLCLPSGKEWSTADVSAAYVSGQSDIRTLVRDLAERWERLAEVHGQRQFTGNDHRLFANELRAIAGLSIAAAPAQPAGGGAG